nr:pentatricopeptide repeat-containing protein At2g17140 [Ipomoea batatas]GME20966.1 pentatricopeptide repeat-containing protein At2g17140 [Ipomoea batatas]
MVRQQTKRRSGGLIRRGGDRRLQLGALGRRGVRVLGLSRLAVQALRASGGDNLESARDVLKRMMGSGYGFDPASFMQVIDGLPRMGNKREFDELADHMIEMVSTGMVSFISSRPLSVLFALNGCCILLFQNSIVQKDDGTAMRSLKRVLKWVEFLSPKG